MTTLLAAPDALVVRYDECRRLWPVTRQRLEVAWRSDTTRDVHRCPVCVSPRLSQPAAPALDRPGGPID